MSARNSRGGWFSVKRRVPPEELARLGVLDVRLDADEPVAPRRVEHLVQDVQQLVVGVPHVADGPEKARELLERADDHLRRVADHDRAEGRSPDDDELGHLHEHREVAAVHGVSQKNASYDDGHPDADGHSSPSRLFGSFVRRPPATSSRSTGGARSELEGRGSGGCRASRCGTARCLARLRIYGIGNRCENRGDA